MTRVLVTGGAGFIGSHVVDALVDRGADVRVLDSLHPAAHAEPPSYLRDDVEYLFGDITDPSIVAAAVADVDAVSHQAAMVGMGATFQDAPAYVTHNDLGTAVLLAGLHSSAFTGRFVLASSMVVYGEGAYRCATHGGVRPAPRDVRDLAAGRYEPRCPTCGEGMVPEAVTESAPLDPRSTYAATKLHQEHLCSIFGRELGAPVTALRYHNVYGPRMPRDTPYAGVASIFRSALEDGRAPTVYEDGDQRRDFVHVADVAAANVSVLTAERAVTGAVNIGSGNPRRVLDLAHALRDAIGSGAPPPDVVGGFRAGDVRHVFASIERARQVIGWRPQIEFGEGVQDFARAPLRATVGAP